MVIHIFHISYFYELFKVYSSPPRRYNPILGGGQI